MGVQGGWGCAARAQTQRAERAEIAHLTSSRELCAAPRRSSLELVDGGQLPDSVSSLPRRDIRISGRELHMYMRPNQRETQVQAGLQSCSRGWGMRGARTRDGLLAVVPPSIMMSRSSFIALSVSRAGLMMLIFLRTRAERSRETV